MKKLILASAFFFLSFTTLKSQIQGDLANRLQFILDSISTGYGIKGISAAVLIPGGGTWKGVSGYSHQGVKLNPDMLFCMGSNTKTHMSVLLLKLQEQQVIDLDDSIGKWIQGYPNINGKATLRQCLSHTTGIADYFANASINDSILSKPGKIWTSEDILKMVKKPLFKPGNAYSYSNTNYIILGIILEKVLNKSPFKALDELVLDPLGFTHTYNFTDVPHWETPAHPWTMNLTGNSLTDLAASPYIDQLFSLAETAGGMMTTAEENVLFWHKLYSGKLISPESWKEMTTMRKIGSGYEYGLGIMRTTKTNGRVVYEHGGTFFGFLCENMVDTLTGVCISVLSNQDSMNNYGLEQLYILSLHDELLRSVLMSLEEQDQPGVYSMYPNPAGNLIHIKVPVYEQGLMVEILDARGNRVSGKDLSGHDDILDLSGLAPGVYCIRFTDNRDQIKSIEKLVISR